MTDIEGSSLRKASGAASQAGNTSFLNKMFGKPKDGGSRKTGTDYYNENIMRDKDVARTLKIARENAKKKLNVKSHKGGSQGHSFEAYPVSGGGQGTSGNVQGPQFTKDKNKGRPTSAGKTPPAKPRAPRKPRAPKEAGSGELLV